MPRRLTSLAQLLTTNFRHWAQRQVVAAQPTSARWSLASLKRSIPCARHKTKPWQKLREWLRQPTWVQFAIVTPPWSTFILRQTGRMHSVNGLPHRWNPSRKAAMWLGQKTMKSMNLSGSINSCKSDGDKWASSLLVKQSLRQQFLFVLSMSD